MSPSVCGQGERVNEAHRSPLDSAARAGDELAAEADDVRTSVFES